MDRFQERAFDLLTSPAMQLIATGAIAVAYSMVQLLPDQDAAKLGGMFEDYVAARLAFFEAGAGGDQVDPADRDFSGRWACSDRCR